MDELTMLIAMDELLKCLYSLFLMRPDVDTVYYKQYPVDASLSVSPQNFVFVGLADVSAFYEDNHVIFNSIQHSFIASTSHTDK